MSETKEGNVIICGQCQYIQECTQEKCQMAFSAVEKRIRNFINGQNKNLAE